MEPAGLSLSLGALCATAAGVGFVHTLSGPDHYVPFVAMSRVGRWSLTKTTVITLLCGIAHVLSSVVLGIIGIAVGFAVFESKLEAIEGIRGSLAGWLLLAFGLAYLTWGIHRAIRNKPHTHFHVHDGGSVHSHAHSHTDNHAHVHAAPYAPDAAPEADAERAGSLTPWVLFTIFVFGPCEPLIPLVMYPAAEGSVWGVVLVTLIFGAVTLATMTTIVLLTCFGTTKLTLGRYQRFSHATAGLLVTACGAAILLGL